MLKNLPLLLPIVFCFSANHGAMAQRQSATVLKESSMLEPAFLTEKDATLENSNVRRVSSTADTIPIGQSSNVYSVLYNDPRLLVDYLTNSITFIRRAGPSDNFGARTQNMIVYDKSTDFGVTWTLNEGTIYDVTAQGADTLGVRYPLSGSVRESNVNHPDSVRYFTIGPTVSLSRNFWNGRGYTMQQPKSVVAQADWFRHHSLTSMYRITGLSCQNPKNAFFVEHQVPFGFPDQEYRDFIKITKIRPESSSSLMVKSDSVFMPTPRPEEGRYEYDLMPPNLAFDPSGRYGFMVQSGYDTTRNPYKVYEPIISFTSDSGNSWSAPRSLNINTGPSFQAMRDSLYGDSIYSLDLRRNIKVYYGAAYETGVSVDRFGNLHLVFPMCVAAPTFGSDFGIHPTFKKLMCLVIIRPEEYDYNQVTPFSLGRFSGFRSEFRFSGITLFHDNRIQVSRNHDGSKLAYSWTSSDTLLEEGCLGCNRYPDIYSASSKAETGLTYLLSATRNYSKNTLSRHKFVFPSISKEAINLPNDSLLVPVVYIRFLNNQEIAPVQHYYSGVVRISNHYPNHYLPFGPTLDVPSAALQKTELNVLPNPTFGKFSIFGLSEGTYQLSVSSLQGKLVFTKVFRHQGGIKSDFELPNLPAGIYSCRITNGATMRFLKLVLN